MVRSTRLRAAALIAVLALAIAGVAVADSIAHRRALTPRDHAVSRSPDRHRQVHAASQSGSAGTGSCAPSDMSLTLVRFEAFMFHYANIYALTNKGSVACTLDGYPSVVVLERSVGRGSMLRTGRGHRKHATPIPIRTSRADSAPWGEKPTPVTIRPGASAGLIIGYVENPNAICRATTPVSRGPTFEITLPGTTAPLRTDQTHFGVCPAHGAGQHLYVSPILLRPQPIQQHR